MRVLLICPTPPADSWPRGVFLYSVVPTEAAQTAALLRRHGHPVRLLQREAELAATGFDWGAADARLGCTLREFAPEQVVFFSPSAAAAETFRLAGLVRSVLGSGPSLLLAGPHATALPEESLAACPELDGAVVGELEWTLLEMAQEGTGPSIAGLLPRPTEGPAKLLPRAACADLDRLPPPAWDLCAMDYYTARSRWLIRWLPMRVLNLRTSRGCPNACRFCAAPLTAGAGVRFHSVDYVLAMMEQALRKYSIDGLLFEDETFAADEDRLQRLCLAIRQRGWHRRLQWACCLRADQAQPELLREMRAAGCIQVEYGFETASDRLLQAIGKNTSVAQNLAAARRTRAAGLRVYANMMFGLPGETARDMADNLRFIRAIRPEVLSAAIMAPLPGTPLFEGLDEGQRKNLKWGDFAYLDQPRPGFNPTAMEEEEFLENYRRIRKYFIRPLVLRQLLRDAGNEGTALVGHWRKEWRRFYLRHPLRAWRLSF